MHIGFARAHDCSVLASPLCSVLTDEPDNQTVIKALPVIDMHLAAKEAEVLERARLRDAGEESSSSDDDDDDDDDSDDDEEEEDDDDGGGGDQEEEPQEPAQPAPDASVLPLGPVNAAATLEPTERPTTGKEVIGDIRNLVDSLVEEESMQSVR